MEASKELVCSNLFPTPLPSLKFSFCCHLYLEGLLYLNRYINKIQLNRSVKKLFASSINKASASTNCTLISNILEGCYTRVEI